MSPIRGRLGDVGITNGDTGFWVKYQWYQSKSLNHRFHLTCYYVFRILICMVYGLFQPTQRAFVKHILVLSVIIFISIQTVYAEYANKYGIKYRFAANQNNRFLKGLKNEKYDDEEAIEIEGDNKGRIAGTPSIL